MDSEQLSLGSSLNTADAKGYLSESTIQELSQEFESLDSPEYSDPITNITQWQRFIKRISEPECIRIRDQFSTDSAEYKLLSAIAMSKTGSAEYISESFTVTSEDEELETKLNMLLPEVLQRIPITALLSNWISNIYLVSAERQQELVGEEDSPSGYYHPDEHWIAVSWDAGIPDSSAWPTAETEHPTRYESSILIHEIGHAFHYMLGIQLENTETVDNRQRENIDISLVPFNYTPIYCTLKQKVSSGYQNLFTGVSESLDWQEYSKKSLEEYIAEGFCAYITAPRYLAEEQPELYSAFETITMD
jgi:hypothetical protein